MPPLPWRNSQSIEPDTTYVVTVTRLPLASYRYILRIMRATLRIRRELARSDGLVGYALNAQLFRKTFWTMSAWADRDALAGFVRSETHRGAMASLSPHMNGPRIETFTLRGSELPPKWPDAAHQLEERSHR
jgi:hypothetical protein